MVQYPPGRRIFLAAFFLSCIVHLCAQTTEPQPQPLKWFETFSIRGYVQFRYNRLFETNPDLQCEQCDKSWGGAGGFFLRRTRVILFGQISQRIYYYVQPDFAVQVSGNGLHFAQLRDAYIDAGLDRENTFRFRIGQSKVPFGFENLQSSQNRLPLDRCDALNGAVTNERDIGVFFYWAPAKTRRLYSDLVRTGLKGSGDYGVFALGAYNGQTANRPELNDNRHIVARISYPFEKGKQIIEPGIQAYTGKYVVSPDQLSQGVKLLPGSNYTDQRVAVSLVVYPIPLGIQAEYNIGRGPEFNPVSDSIEISSLEGGYATISYLIRTAKSQVFVPFTRVQYYDGGKKTELDARSYTVRELEVGVEWQPAKQFELTAMYTISSRRSEDFRQQDNHQRGSLLRLQAQVNF